MRDTAQSGLLEINHGPVSSPQYSNPHEAAIITEKIRQLVCGDGLGPADIAVVSVYDRQAVVIQEKIQKELGDAYIGVQVRSLDALWVCFKVHSESRE